MIEHWGTRHFVGLKLGHFGLLPRPFEVIEVESERGTEMGGAVGVIMCLRCRASVMHNGVAVGVWCL